MVLLVPPDVDGDHLPILPKDLLQVGLNLPVGKLPKSRLTVESRLLMYNLQGLGSCVSLGCSS